MPPRFFRRALLVPTLVIAALLSAAPQSSAAPTQSKKSLTVYQLNVQNERLNVLVTLRKSENVKVEYPFSEALVGDPSIADVVPLTNQSIYILGKKIGVTRLSLLDQRKQVIGVVDIEVSHDLEGLRRHLRENPALRGVKVTSINGKVLLTGTVPDAIAIQSAMQIAEQMAPGDATNSMQVAAPQQVMLEVRFIEASRSAERGLGVNWVVGKNGAGSRIGAISGVNTVTSGGITSTPGGINTDAVMGLASGLASNAIPFGTAVGRVLNGGVKADIVVRALEEQGLARRLAEPNLVALSGGSANFLAGGEFPFPIVSQTGQLGIEFKKFGVGLSFTPTVLSNGQINLKIDPEVSELDPTNNVQLGSYSVPSLVVRRASTSVELRDGQSFAIAGLLQGSHIADQQAMPWIGDVPVMGQLFRSSSFQKQETDLVIIVTPRLVKPAVPGQRLRTPLDAKAPANDAEFFLNGKQEVDTHAQVQLAGHILDYNAAEPTAQSYWGSK